MNMDTLRMPRRTRAALVLGIAAAACVLPSAWAQSDEKLPDAADILEKYVEVTGGKEAYEKVKARITRGKIEVPAMGMSGTLESVTAAPNLLRAKANIEGVGEQTRGTNGEVAWELSDMLGPRIVEGKEKAMFERSSLFNSDVHWRKLYETVRTVGVENVGDTPCYKLELVAADEDVMTAFYAKDSGLLLRALLTVPGPMGDMEVEVLLSDYRDVDGVKLPHKTVQRAAGMEQVMTIDSVETNPKLAPDAFDLPMPIKELLKAAEATSKPTGGSTP